MSEFGDKLRARLSRRDQAAGAAVRRQAEEQQSAAANLQAADAAARAVVAEVFVPLLQELKLVLESADIKILRSGTVRADSMRQLPGSTPGKPRRANYLANGADNGDDSERGSERGKGDRLYEFALSAAASEAGTLELSLTFKAGTPQDFRRKSAEPLLEFAPTISDAGDHSAARQWAADLLQQCAGLLIDSNDRPAAAACPAPIHAPLAAMPMMPMTAGVFST